MTIPDARTKGALLLVISCLIPSGCSEPESSGDLAEGQRHVTGEQVGSSRAPAGDTSSGEVDSEDPEALVDEARFIVRTLSLLSQSERDAGERERAKQLLVQALTRDREFAPAYVELAMLEATAGSVSGSEQSPTERYTNAKKLIDRALELDPESALAHQVKSRIHVGEQDFRAATQSLERAEMLGLSDAESNSLRSSLALARGNLQEALALAQDVVQESSAPRYARMEMASVAGSLMMLQGDYQGAIAVYEKAQQIEPGFASLHIALASLYQVVGDWDRAIDNAQVLIGVIPGAENVLSTAYAGKVVDLYKQSRNDEARQLTKRLETKLAVENTQNLMSLADFYKTVYEQTGRDEFLEFASEALRDALAIDANLAPAKSRLEELESVGQ